MLTCRKRLTLTYMPLLIPLMYLKVVKPKRAYIQLCCGVNPCHATSVLVNTTTKQKLTSANPKSQPNGDQVFNLCFYFFLLHFSLL